MNGNDQTNEKIIWIKFKRMRVQQANCFGIARLALIDWLIN